MVIFTTLRDIPQDMLLYKGIRQVIKYNLTSYFMEAQTLSSLVPSAAYISSDVIEGDYTAALFDTEYHNSIINNGDSFCDLMNIMVPAYTSPETLVHIMVDRSPYCDAITESLIKLIQQRYGYNAYTVFELEDFLYTSESDMSIPGVFTIDQDLNRWRSMVTTNQGGVYNEYPMEKDFL